MLPSCDIAFKEWAAVCQALAEGRQSVILRKGGIEEGPQGFQPIHESFWLYPTQFHQTGDELQPHGREFLTKAAENKPAAGTIRLSHFVIVEDVIHIEDEGKLADLLTFTILSDETIRQRFYYRDPGLFCMIARVFESKNVVTLEETSEFAGCKSWVELEQLIPTDDLRPAISDAEFKAIRSDLHARMR